ncbi:MAG TPA: HAD family hydrolase [Anaerolineales bacterium]|jgi:HAD superfamily hydrolase (TIGR01509 family)
MPLDLSRIQALCFDVDGTLNDTDDQFIETIALYFKTIRFMLPRQDYQRAARRMVMWAEAPGNLLMGVPDKFGLDDELARLASWISQMRKASIRHFRPVPGVEEMIKRLYNRYPLAVVSARHESTTREFLSQTGLERYFSCVAGALTVKHTKPYPDPIYWAAKQMGVQPGNCLMIGDTTVDILAGKAAGAQTVGVLCGFGEEPELRRLGADMTLETTSKLEETLLNETNPSQGSGS